MSTTQRMQNKAGTRVGLSVDEGKLKLKGGTSQWENENLEKNSDGPRGGGITPGRTQQTVSEQEMDEQEFNRQMAELEQKRQELYNKYKSQTSGKSTPFDQSNVDQEKVDQSPGPPLDKRDLNFGSYWYVLKLINCSKKDLSKAKYYVNSSLSNRETMRNLLEATREIYDQICDKLNDQIGEIKWQGSCEDDLVLEKQYINEATAQLNKALKQLLPLEKELEILQKWQLSVKDYFENKQSGLDLANNMMSTKSRAADPTLEHQASEDDERTLAFQAMKAQQDINPSELKCTRVCNQFKTGVPCTHPNCTFAHYLCDLKPKPCIYAKCGCNREHNGCEFAHITKRIPKAGGGETLVYETALEVTNRLNLKKQIPISPEHEQKLKPTVEPTVEPTIKTMIDSTDQTKIEPMVQTDSFPILEKQWSDDGVSMNDTKSTIQPFNAADLDQMKQQINKDPAIINKPNPVPSAPCHTITCTVTKMVELIAMMKQQQIDTTFYKFNIVDN